MNRFTMLAVALLIASLTVASYANSTAQKDKLEKFNIRQVKIGGRIGRQIDDTVKSNFLVLDYEHEFLDPFRDRNRTGGYIGLGKTIDALVHIAAYSGQDRLVKLKNQIVEETINAQQSDGYIGIMQRDSRIWALWDVHEMAYIVQGLTSDYRLFKRQKSLDAAVRLADYVLKGWLAEPAREPGGGEIGTQLAVIGIETALLGLYEQTHHERYLKFCVESRKLPRWQGRIVQGRWGPIDGHVYSYLARCVAQMQLSRIRSPQLDHTSTQQALDFLIDKNGLVITGAAGLDECWDTSQSGSGNLGETCATAYLIRLYDELYRVTGDTYFGDLMERSIYNALFAAQSPDCRRIRYYTPFSGPREYFSGDTYCCPCNFRRIIAELPEMVYYRWGKGVAVNLYTTSTIDLTLANNVKTRIRQDTAYPHVGTIEIRVEPDSPVNFPLALRLPRWCLNPAVSINQELVTSELDPGSSYVIDRTWRRGDFVTLRLPMVPRLIKGRNAQSGRVAVMRGPQVYCLNRTRNDIPPELDLQHIVIDSGKLGAVASGNSAASDNWTGRIPIASWGDPQQTRLMRDHDASMLLTEFTDPLGERVFFRVSEPKHDWIVDDELIGREDTESIIKSTHRHPPKHSD